MEQGIHLQPVIALGDDHPWAASLADPHPAQDGFEAHPMLIGGPQFDGRFWVGLLERA